MYGDSALFCVAASLGLLAAIRQCYRLTRITGMLLAAAANLHLTADLAGFSVSIHKFFPSITARMISPAEAAHIQIAPLTAVVFFLFGCALALLSRRMNNQVLAVKVVIGVTLSAIGLIVLCGYMGGPLSSAISGMAFLTACCTVALGVSVCALSLLHMRSVSEELSPSSVVIMAIGIVLVFGGTDIATIVKNRIDLLSASGVDSTYSEMRSVQKTVALIWAAESSKRGFLLTHNASFLAHYLLTAAELRAELAGDELLHIPEWQEHRLPALISERIDQLDHTIQVERQGRHRESVELIDQDVRAALTEQIQSEAQFVIRDLEARADGQKAIRQILIQNLMNIVMACYGIAILLVAVTVSLARFEAKRHERTSMRVGEKELCEPAGWAGRVSAPEPIPSQKRVLLIDDCEDLMRLVQYAFQKHGNGEYVLSWAKCLKDGFRELIEGGVDVVLLDLGLPESSGLISYAAVRGCAPEVPVIVMTGGDCQETEELIVAAGADDYLVKQQISGLRLVQVIQSVLERKRPPQVNLRRTLAEKTLLREGLPVPG